MNFSSMLRYITDIIYPNKCPCCNNFIPWKKLLCETCQKEIAIDQDSICAKCGKEKANCMCAEDLPYSKAYVATFYEGAGKEGILSLKRSDSLQFAMYTAQLVAEQISTENTKCADYIIPVPMEKRKKRKRYANPSELFGKYIGKELSIPMDCSYLKATGIGKTQHTLNADQRKKNLGRFRSTGKQFQGETILLVDDVLTTGTTLRECADILLQNGAGNIKVAVIATTRYQKETTKK